MSKQLNEREKNAKEAEKREEQAKKSVKASSTLNTVDNNEVKRRGQEANGRNRRERRNLLRAANANRRGNNTQSSSPAKGLCLLIFCVAIALFLGTLIAQLFGGTTQSVITTD